MARKTSTNPTRIWKFGAQAPLQADASRVQEILWRSSRYYNKLVEIERDRCARFQSIRREHAPDLAALEDEFLRIDDAIEALHLDAKRSRQSHWRATKGEKTLDVPPEIAEKIAVLAADKKRASADAKPLRAAFNARLAADRERFKSESSARANGGGPRIKSAANAAVLEEMLADDGTDPVWRAVARSDDEAHRATLSARASCGISPGTYLATEEAFSRAKKDSAPRAPSFRRFDGGGKIAVQLRGVTWANLLSGASSMLHLRHSPRADSRGDQSLYYVARIRIGSDERAPIWLDVPVKLHRQPPLDSTVKWAWIIVRREGERMRYELQVTLEHESFAEPKRPAGVGDSGHIRLGWSTVESGVRVATWDDGEVVVPDSILERATFADAVHGAADDHYNAMLRALRLWMRRGPNRFTTWHRLRKERDRLALRRLCVDYAKHRLGDDVSRTLWRAWVESRPRDLFPSLGAADRWMRERGHVAQEDRMAWWLYCWARKDAHLRDLKERTQKKFERSRDQFFRDQAILIATKYGTAAVDSYSIAALKKLPTLKMPGDHVAPHVRTNLQDAAPGRFREILLDVMGPRCTPCERSGGDELPGTAREPENQGRKRRRSAGAAAFAASGEAAEQHLSQTAC